MGISPFSPGIVSDSLETLISAGQSSNIYTGQLSEEMYLCLHTGLVYQTGLSQICQYRLHPSSNGTFCLSCCKQLEKHISCQVQECCNVLFMLKLYNTIQNICTYAYTHFSSVIFLVCSQAQLVMTKYLSNLLEVAFSPTGDFLELSVVFPLEIN